MSRVAELESQLAESEKLNLEKDAQIQLLRSELAKSKMQSVPTQSISQGSRKSSMTRNGFTVRNSQGFEFKVEFTGKICDGAPDGWGRGECSDGNAYSGWWKQNGGTSYILGICQVELSDGSKYYGHLGDEQSPGSGTEKVLFTFYIGEHTTPLYTRTGLFKGNDLQGLVPEELRYKDFTKRGWLKAFQDHKKQAEEWEKQPKK